MTGITSRLAVRSFVWSLAAALVSSAIASAGSVAFPVPLDAAEPNGSLVYEGQASGSVSVAAEVDDYTIDLDAGQTLTVVVVPGAALTGDVEVLDPSSSSLGTATGAAAGDTVVLQDLPVATDGTYTVSVTGSSGTIGTYSLQLILNAAVEEEENGGAANETQATAQNIDGSFVSLGGSKERAAVLGALQPTYTVEDSENFEGGTLGADWTTYSSSSYGRIQVNTTMGGAESTSYSILMDATSSYYTLNEAVWTVDLSSLGSQVGLVFWHCSSGDELYTLPQSFSGHAYADGVAISDDGTSWYTVASAMYGTSWEQYSIDLSAAAAAAGMTLNSTFRIKFQQYDELSYPSDGRAYDQIKITSPATLVDWYECSASTGDRLDILASGSGIGLSLYDSGGTLLADGLSPGKGERVANFVAPSNDTYGILVTGAADYTLVVSRECAFELEVNDVPADAQDVSASGAVLGHIGAQNNRLFASPYGMGAVIIELDPTTGAQIASIPCPNGVAPISVNGLAYDGSKLYYIDPYADDTLYELDPDTGAVIDSDFIMGSGFYDGVAAVGGKIYILDRGVYQILEFDTTLDTITNSFYPGPAIYGGLSGIKNPDALLVTAGSYVYELDPATGATVSSFAATSSNGLAVVDDEIHLATTGSYVYVYQRNGTFLRSYLPGTNLFSLGGDGLGADDADCYAFAVASGDMLTVTTTTPADGTGEFVNDLDPALELLDPSGTSVAADDNSASDGRNAEITHTAATSGTYTIRVTSSANAGEYVLEALGSSATAPPLSVTATDPVDGAALHDATTLTVDFSGALLVSSLDAADLTVDGTPATAVTLVDGNTAVFDLPTLTPGTLAVEMAAGAVTGIDDSALDAYNGTLEILPTFRITSSSVQDGDNIAPGNVTLSFTFNLDLAYTGIGTNDYVLMGSARGLQMASGLAYDIPSKTLDIAYTSLPEDSYTLTLYSGNAAFEDLTGFDLDGEALTWPIPANETGDGTEGGNFVVAFTVDVTTDAFPTPLIAVSPAGSLVYRGDVGGGIMTVGDVDEFTLDLDADQALTLIVQPSSGLTPAVELLDPSSAVLASAAASVPGEPAMLDATSVTSAGTHTIAVTESGGTTGDYQVFVVLNACAEAEPVTGAPNDALASAQDLDAALIDVSATGSRTAVVGQGGAGVVYAEDFEGGTLGAEWSTYSSHAYGRVQIGTTAGAAEGTTYALMMDSSSSSYYILNEAVLTVNLMSMSQYSISFWHRTTLDEADTLVSPFTGHQNGDGVSISDDGTTWYTVLNSPVASSWTLYTIDLTAAAASAGMTLGAGFQIKFQQYDNYYMTTDGRAWDQIEISGPPSNADWYSVTVGASQSVALGLAMADPTGCSVSLYDGTGALLTTGGPGATNYDLTSGDVATSVAGTYYVEVLGAASEYALVVARDLSLEHEPNDIPADAQDVTLTGGALGALDTTQDCYAVSVTAGDALTIATSTPADGAGEFDNTVDPAVELYDPSGTLVASDDNSAADGHNAEISHTATASGAYTVVVLASAGTGEYVLEVQGATGALLPIAVTGTDPVDGDALHAAPTMTVTLSNAVLVTSIDASDLQLNGVPATAVTMVDGTTLTFDLPTTLPAGTYSVTMAAGSVTATNGAALEAYSGLITLLPPFSVASSSVADGDTVPAGGLSVTITFNLDFQALNLDGTDITFIGTRVGPLPVIAPTYDVASRTLTVPVGPLVDDEYTLTLRSGDSRFEDTLLYDLDGDGDGVEGGDFTLTFHADLVTSPLATPLTPVPPLGGLVYAATADGTVASAADVDLFTIDLDAPQTLSVALTPDAGLRATIEVLDPSSSAVKSASAPAAGEPAVLNCAAVSTGGTYTIRVSNTAAAAGSYHLDVALNASVEDEAPGAATNDSSATAQDIDESFVTLAAGCQRGALLGMSAPAEEDWFSLTLPSGAELTVLLTAFGGITPILEIYDESDLVSMGGTVGVTASLGSIGYVNADAAPTTAYLRVLGAGFGTDYGLTVVRGGTFDLEPNDDTAGAQEAWPSGIALGHIVGGSAGAPVSTEVEPNDDGVSGATAADFALANDLSGSFNNTVGDTYVATVDGTIGAGNNLDWDFFRIQADTGDVLLIELDGVTLGDTYLLLYDDSGTSLAYNDDGGPGLFSLIDYTITGPGGDFYVVADSFGSGTGTYTLTVTLTTTSLSMGNVDCYAVNATASDTLTVTTSTPGDGTGEFVNILDPSVEVIDPSGAVVATDDNSAADGRNATLTYPTAVEGTHTVRVRSAGGSGEYVVSITGATGDPTALTVTGTFPAENADLNLPPASIALAVSSGLLITSVDPEDILINDAPAATATVFSDTTIHVTAAAYGPGYNTVTVLPGSFTGLNGAPVEEYVFGFYLPMAPRVIDSTVQDGDLLAAGMYTFDFTFSEDLDVTDLDVFDFELLAPGAFPVAPTGWLFDTLQRRLTVSYILSDLGAYQLTLLSGDGHFEGLAGLDLDGEAVLWPIGPNVSGDRIEGGDFVVSFDVCDTIPDLVVAGMTAIPPVAAPGDTVAFTVEVMNRGLADAGMFTIGFWPDLDAEPAVDTPASQERDVGGLAQGATIEVTFEVVADEGGTMHAWAFADCLLGIGEVSEIDETNNAGPPQGVTWSVLGGQFGPLGGGCSPVAHTGRVPLLLITLALACACRILRKRVAHA